jgi:hypothetical protein
MHELAINELSRTPVMETGQDDDHKGPELGPNKWPTWSSCPQLVTFLTITTPFDLTQMFPTGLCILLQHGPIYTPPPE